MLIRLIQKSVIDLDFADRVRQGEKDGIQLLIFPELSTTGCLYEVRQIPSTDQLLDSLRSEKVRVVVGSAAFENGSYFNRLNFLYGSHTSFYTKVNLFPGMHEPDVYTPGNRAGMFLTDIGRIGVAICYDLRFDNYFNELKMLNPDFVIISAAWPKVRIADWERLLAQRAVELGVTVIGVNAVGDDGTNLFGGSSRVVDKSGTVLLDAGYQPHTTLHDFELVIPSAP